MADSEKSYTDRLAKLQSIYDACLEFVPVFSPADTNITIGSLETFLLTVAAANSTVGDAEVELVSAANDRVAMLKTVKRRSTQVVNYLKSNPVWKGRYHAAKMAIDRLRGTRPPKSALPPEPPAPGDPPKSPRNRGQQAYEECAGHFESIIKAAAGAFDYAPANTEISIASLNTLLDSFRVLNTTLSALETTLTAARCDRRFLYDTEDTGAAARFQSIKAAVKAQYSIPSTQWDAVKGMTW